MRGSGAESLSGVWGGSPNVPPNAKQKEARAGEEPKATITAGEKRLEADVSTAKTA